MGLYIGLATPQTAKSQVNHLTSGSSLFQLLWIEAVLFDRIEKLSKLKSTPNFNFSNNTRLYLALDSTEMISLTDSHI